MRTLKAVLAAALLLPLAAAGQAQDRAPAPYQGLDVYRSRRLTAAQVRELAGPLLDSFIRTRQEHRRGTQKVVARLKSEVEAKLREASGAAFLALSVGEYVTSAEKSVFVTVDVVDPEDAKTRMPFRAAPAGHPADPDGLLAAWQQYFDQGDALARQGLIDGESHPSCPGFYCQWGSPNQDMAALEKKIAAGAIPQRKALEGVLAREADPAKRAAALFVLSYLPDGKAVVDYSLEALSDPGEPVRAAALQILSDVALYHKAVLIDFSRVLPVLDYPTVDERSKALSVLVGLGDNPSYKPLVLTRGTPYLLGLLRLRQPSNHDLAFTLLSTLSSQSLAQRDYAGWAAWVKSQTSAASEVPGVTTDEAPAAAR